MRRSRTLNLKRDDLSRLDSPALGAVVGNGPATVAAVLCLATDTCQSCLHYMSCNAPECHS